MLRSASSFLILSLLFLQVAIAQFIGDGVYLIHDYEGLFLGIGPVPFVYPPIDVPVRLFPEGSRFVEKWLVKKGPDGGFVISALQQYDEGYKMVIKDDYVFVSTQKAPESWAVTSVGDDKFEIKTPNEDRVFTSVEDFPQIHLAPAQGLDSQKWNFIRLDRYDDYHRGSRNRFCKQERW